MGKKVGVLVSQRLDVPNIFKDVPNFIKDVSNFVKDVPRGSSSVMKWETTSNHFLRLSKVINGPKEGR